MEKRSNTRVIFDVNATINYNNKTIKGNVVNLSLNGLLLRTEEDIPKEKGTRINGVGINGKVQVSYGVELTKNGKNIVNQFIDPLYEEQSGGKNEESKINKKEDE